MIRFKSICLLFNKKIFPIISPAKYISQHVLYSRPSINWRGENFSPHTNNSPSYFNMAETFSVGMHSPPLFPLAVSLGLCVPLFCICCLCHCPWELFRPSRGGGAHHTIFPEEYPWLNCLNCDLSGPRRQLKMQDLFLPTCSPGRSCDKELQSLVAVYVKLMYMWLEKTFLTLE